MAARTLRGVDQLPALGHVDRGGNLHGHVLAVLHGVNGQRHVIHPVGSYIYKVYVVALAQLLIGLGPHILVGLRTARVRQHVLALGHVNLLKIAETFDLKRHRYE